jgi:hypothetical protein
MEEPGMARREELLASYGADPRRWPQATREKAPPPPDGALREAREIDHVLSLATAPSPPPGAVERLLRHADLPAGRTRSAMVRPPPRRPIGYLSALPLAASLAAGIYLGAQGMLDALLPSAITGEVAIFEDLTDELGGVGEADAYAGEQT